MAPQTGTAILVLVVFVLPGFVALRYAEQTYRTRAEDSALERVLSALYFSLLSYLVIAGGALALFEIDEQDVGLYVRADEIVSVEFYEAGGPASEAATGTPASGVDSTHG